jgi:NAD(P)-dependent dehydrogenase (short-subunit alcohol dehydrogenase family)
MLLEDKNAIVYGGGGAVGGAVDRAFAREGGKHIPRRPHPCYGRSGGRGDHDCGRNGRDGASRCSGRKGRREAHR